MKGVNSLINLKLMMDKAGISCLDLSKKLNVSQQAVYKWESGAALPSASKLPDLAAILGCTIDELYGRGEDSA